MATSISRSPLRAVGSRLPDGLKTAIVDTPLHEVYLHARKHTVNLETVEFDADGERFVLDVPAENYRPDQEGTRVYEPGLTRELISALGPRDVFYDVGAHHGYMTELARTAGVDDAAIHSFEGNTFNEYVLTHNVGESAVTVNGEFVGTASEMCSIDDYVGTHRPPTVVKVDVEGAECDVFESMRSTLAANPVTLYAEIHPAYLPQFGDAVEDVQSLLTDVGYEYEITAHRSNDDGWHDVGELPDDDGYLLRAGPADAR